MHAACEDRTSFLSRGYCFAMADVAVTAVNGNSWRQSYLTPVAESGFGYGTAGVLAVSAFGFTLMRSRRLDPSNEFSYSPKAIAA